LRCQLGKFGELVERFSSSNGNVSGASGAGASFGAS